MSAILCPINRVNESKPISWLWRPYLAAGKLTLLDGDPGSGKSMITIDIAARLSRAAAMPDGSAPAAPCRTLLLNAEDDPGDTLIPRLRAAGADLDQVLVPSLADGQEVFQLPRDLDKIQTQIREFQVGLLIVDPLTGFVPPNLAEGGPSAARLAVAPLALLAERTGVAVLIVRHLTKRPRERAIRRGLGSMSIMGLARIGLIVGRDPRDPQVGLLAVTKTNLGAAPNPLAFHLKPHDDCVVVDWLGAKNETADRACGQPDRVESPGVVRATLWLIDALANGPRPAAELLAAAKADGINEKTLDRAKRSLGFRSEFTRQPDGRRAWLWRAPKEPTPSFLEPVRDPFARVEDPIRRDLPKDMSKETSEILDRERFEWALKNLRPR